MPFYVYSGENLEHRHENIQLLKIINSVKDHYRDSEEYCFALINPQFINNDIHRQYDLLLFEKSCISVIEMKNMSGNIHGTLIDDKGNSENLYIETDNANLFLSWDQICHQRSYLLNFMGRNFKKTRQMKEENMFRIDQYWIFNDPINTDNLVIKDPRYEKWLTITTIKDFYNSFFSAKKNHPFNLSEDDIRALAKSKFKLKLRSINKLFTPLVPAIKKLSNDLIELSDQDLDEDFYTLKDEFNNQITKDEFEFLEDFMININTYFKNQDKTNKLREILKKINISSSENKILKILHNNLVKLIINMNNDILRFLSLDFYNSPAKVDFFMNLHNPQINPIYKIHNLITEIHLSTNNQEKKEIMTEDQIKISNNLRILSLIIEDIKNPN